MRSVASLAHHAEWMVEKSWRLIWKLSGFPSSCFIKSEPQRVARLLGPVVSLYRRGQIVVVEQWRRATNLGKIVARNAREELSKHLLQVRVRWRCHSFHEQTRCLTPDFLALGRQRQPF